MIIHIISVSAGQQNEIIDVRLLIFSAAIWIYLVVKFSRIICCFIYLDWSLNQLLNYVSTSILTIWFP